MYPNPIGRRNRSSKFGGYGTIGVCLTPGGPVDIFFWTSWIAQVGGFKDEGNGRKKVYHRESAEAVVGIAILSGC